MNFREWLQIEEKALSEAAPANPFKAGTTRSRPSGSFAANRSQLWGPSAQYGRADTMMPWTKPFPAIMTGIGQSYRDSLGYSPQAIPELPWRPPKEKHLEERWGILPLQLPPGGFEMSRRNTLGMLKGIKNLLAAGINDPQMHKGATGGTGGKGEEDQQQIGSDQDADNKFTLMVPYKDEKGEVIDPMGNFELVEQATTFTQALLHYVHVENMAAEGIRDKYDWKDPEVLPNLDDSGNVPMFEAIFRFSLASESEWGSMKDKAAQKQQSDLAAQADSDVAGMAGALAPGATGVYDPRSGGPPEGSSAQTA